MAVAAPPSLTTTGSLCSAGDVIGPHQLRRHPGAGRLLVPGPALALAAIDLHHAVAVTTTKDTAGSITSDLVCTVSEPTPAPSAVHLHQTGTLTADPIGPAPDQTAEGIGGWSTDVKAGFLDPQPAVTEAAQGLDQQDPLSV